MMPAPIAEAGTNCDRPEELIVNVASDQDLLEIDTPWLCRLARSVLQGENVVCGEISLAIVDDEAIRRVHREFLGLDQPTDVISFSLISEAPEAGSPAAVALRHVEGEVVASAQTACRCAAEFEIPPGHELALYVVHGLLHLCGYDDRTPQQQRRMQEREKSHLQKFGIHRHYEG
jgi:probable rRNA maturation factor